MLYAVGGLHTETPKSYIYLYGLGIRRILQRLVKRPNHSSLPRSARSTLSLMDRPPQVAENAFRKKTILIFGKLSPRF